MHKTPQQGAATSVLLAASPLLDGVGGRYFEDCAEAPIVTERPADYSGGPRTRSTRATPSGSGPWRPA